MMIKTLSLTVMLVTARLAFAQQCPTPPPPTNPTQTTMSSYLIHFHVDRVISGQQGFHAERCKDDPAHGVDCSLGTSGWFAINSGYPQGTFNDEFQLLPNTEYYYRTRAYNSCGRVSAYSSPITSSVTQSGPMPYMQAPGAPVNLIAVQDNGEHFVELSWRPGAFPGVPGQHQIFWVVRSDNGSTNRIMESVSETQYVDGSVTIGHTYSYKIKSWDAFGWSGSYNHGINAPGGSPYSNTVTITVQ
jgi:hypothetical protein